MAKRKKSPLDDYMWRQDDLDILASDLQEKALSYQDFVRTSSFYSWCRKSWILYHKLAYQDEGDHEQVGVIAMGDEGELAGAQINHMRNILQHRLNLVTKDRPALIGRARNSDLKSIRQADLGTGLIEYYMREKNAETHAILAVEHSLIFAEGFLLVTWDPAEGREIDADEETLQFTHEGDLLFENPVTWNVIRDLGKREWKDHDWLGVRSGISKWKLMAQFPEHADAIKSAEEWIDVPLDEGDRPFDEDEYFVETDDVEVYRFWHRRSPELPKGKYIIMCGGKIIFQSDMPYRNLTLLRATPAEMSLTPFGYTPAFDLIPIQELINMTASTIATNQNAFGVQSLWKKSGGNLRTSQVLGGMNLVESDVKPEALQLTQTPAEIFNFLDTLIRHQELVAGVDQVTRGYTEENVRSGAFAALLQAQSVQFASGLVRSYHQLLEQMGTIMLRILRDFAQEERVVMIMGKFNRMYQKYFTGDDLDLIDRVTVETTNPLFNTFAGKMEFAKMVTELGLVKNPQEILNTFQSGQVDSLLEAENAQLSAVREENESLMELREIPPAMPEDNHTLHVREHMSIFGTRETRENVELRASVQAHVMSHLELLMGDPNTQLLQTMLGYEMPIPPGAMPEGAGMPTAGPLGNQPQGMQAPELTASPTPMEPGLDGRSVAQPAEPPVVEGA